MNFIPIETSYNQNRTVYLNETSFYPITEYSLLQIIFKNDISKLESRLVDLETEMNRNVELQTAKMRLIDTNGQQKDHIQKIKDGIEFFKTLTELYASNESNFEQYN